jgi:hypothetical protein
LDAAAYLHIAVLASHNVAVEKQFGVIWSPKEFLKNLEVKQT